MNLKLRRFHLRVISSLLTDIAAG